MKSHSHPDHHEPEGPSHNMLVVGEKSIFLSHLPMFMPPHNFQVILEATFTKQGSAVNEIYFKDRKSHPKVKIYSLQPGDINPVRLFGGRLHQPIRRPFKGTVFRGHLERGGQEIEDLADIEVNVKQVIYFSKLGPDFEKPDQLQYSLFGTGPELFLAHVIAGPPDFDQILSVKIDHPPTDEEINRGVSVVISDRANSASQRIKEKEKVQGQAHVTGAHQFLNLQIKAGLEFYFEEGELSSK